MKSFIISIFVCIFIVASAIQSVTAKNLLDDFSGNYLDSSKWNEGEVVREISQGKLISKVGNSTTDQNARNNTPFINASSINIIECDISVIIANPDSGGDSESSARVDGRFYNAQNSGTEKGDIWVGLIVGNRGSGLESWWEVWESTDDDGNNWEEKGSGSLTVPGLTYNQTYTVKIEYDGTNEFTFTVGGISASFTGPTRQGAEFTSYKALETVVYADGGTGNGYVSASFDNVFINEEGSAYDDFSIAPLDQTKWQNLEFVREIRSGNLRLTAHSDGEREQSRVGFTQIYPYIEAKVTINNNSMIEPGDRGIARIDGYFYNDTYGPGSYNGYEGNVWAAIELDDRDGVLKAQCSGSKTLDADDTQWEDLFYREFYVPIIFDRPYKLSIHYTGSQFRLSCKDTVTGREDIFKYDITTSVYAPYDEYRAIRSRVYGNSTGGYMAVNFDDVYVDVAQPSATYDATGEWELIGSNPWSELGCDLPEVGDTISLTITQDGNDFTMAADGDEEDVTFDGVVYGETYQFINDEETEGDRELTYGVFHLSQSSSGTGSVTSHSWTDNIYDCRSGFNIAVTKLADTDGDGTPDISDTDDDNDGVLDVDDAFPLDDTETTDTDEDGTGNNADTDDDDDGISDVTEAAGPNSGDANNDGTLDSLQNNVASVEDYNAQGYVVLETQSGTVLSSCQAAGNPSPGDAPANVVFNHGFFGFTISGIAAGGSTTLTMTLPSGKTVDTYYRYGKTPDNQVDHWYEFLYDGETGAEINNNVITFHFVDALRGDDILIQDSMIIDLGAPGFTETDDDDGGGGDSGCFIITATQ